MITDLLWFPTNRCFIGGSWEKSETRAELSLTNLSDGKVLCNIVRATKKDIKNATSSACQALKSGCGEKNAFERGRILKKMSHFRVT